MQRNSFQDVVPPDDNRRSIRNVQVTRRPRPGVEPKAERIERTDAVFIRREEVSPTLPKAPLNPANLGRLPSSKPRKSKFSKIFGGVAALLILAFIFVMMNAFSSAQIDIVAKSETATVQSALSISNTESSATSSSLTYQVINLSAEKEKEVASSGEEQVERKASAKIVVYNDFSAEPQRLIARTRFQTPEGLIFRINDSIVVPGKANSKPGSLEVMVYADEAGEKYNVGLTDFSVPGFKDDAAMFKGFYARSSTAASGGFIGTAKKVSEADRATALLELQAGLRTDIEKDLISKLDPSLVVLKGGILYEFSELPQSDTSGITASIKEEAKGYAIAFKKTDLNAYIQNQFLKDWQGLPGEISSYDSLSLSFDDSAWLPSKGNLTQIKVNGTAPFIASVDTAVIISRIAGKPKDELSQVVNDTPSIVSAKASVRPIWKSSFPVDADKISVGVAAE